jgi:hypothetical protein
MFGVIDKLKLDAKYAGGNDPSELEPAVGNNSRKPVARQAKLYSMRGFVRGSSAIDIRQTTGDTLKRKAEAVETIERVQKIQVCYAAYPFL